MRLVLLLSVVAGIAIGIVQLAVGNGWGVAGLSAAIAFLVALLTLGIAQRYGRRD